MKPRGIRWFRACFLLLVCSGMMFGASSIANPPRTGPVADPRDAKITITNGSLPGGQVGVPYSQTLSAKGGTTPYSWSLASGVLPDGLSLNSSSGVIGGTPTAAGPSGFIVKVSDSTGASASQSFTINIAAPPLKIATASLADGQVGVTYSQSLQATGGAGIYVWSISSGALPAGLNLSLASGVISGMPTTAGPATFTVRVTDLAFNSSSQSYTVNIAPPVVSAPTLKIGTASLADGQVGAAYSQTLQATGGTGALTWSVSVGTLPAGLSLNGSTGAITGTPTTAGPASFTIKVTDAGSNSATQAYTINIAAAALKIATGSLPDGQVGVAYSQTLQATGGSGALTWSVSTGTLPAGLSLNSSSGAITGTPTTAGPAGFTIKVTDTASGSGTQAYTINIAAAALKIATGSLPDGQVGVAYSQTLQATGGSGALSWSVSAGTLPAGLNLNGTSGAITGTPTTAGPGTFTIKVADTASGSATQAYTINIAAAALKIATGSLPDGQVGVPYSQTLQATGGSGALTWSVSAGTLPAGLSLNGASGAITGTPTTAGPASFTIKVSDTGPNSATQAYTMNVAAAALKIATGSLPDGQVGVAYSQTVQATGGSGGLSWSVSAGTLPAGLSLNGSSGAITGTPTTAGPASFTIKVSDTASNSATQAYTINIAAAALKIATGSLPDGQVGVAYSQTLQATGGSGALSWAVSAGTLPAGLNLSGSSGAIAGTPTAAGSSSFTVTVTDTASNSATQALTIKIAPLSLRIVTGSLPDGQVGVAYSQTLQASGGTGSLTWSVSSGTLPAGLNLNASSGLISGTPTTAGPSTFAIKVTDTASGSATQSYSVNIAAPSLKIITGSLPDGQVAVAYSQVLQANGGTGSYTWAISSGTLPAGLTLNSSSGQISGTPTADGTSTFTVSVTDGKSSASQGFSLRIAASSLHVVTGQLPAGTTGHAYSQTLQASGGTGSYSWTIDSGSLPAGLSLNGASGQISGTPTTAGMSAFTATVHDGVSTASANLSINVIAALAIGSCPTATGSTGQAYSATMSASGGTPPYSWSITTGQLPSGLNLDPQHGAISGTPTASGAANFGVTVADNAAGSATLNCTITISSSLMIGTVSLPDGVVGVQYSQTLSGSGGQPPISWSVAAGALPAGLNLATSGQVSGAPTTPGSFSFTARATDAANNTANKDLAIRIGGALGVASCPAGAAVVGQAYNGTVTASGGSPPYSWAASGALPSGLSIDRASGAISGTPTQAGTNTITVVVSDSTSQTANKACPLNIAAALAINTTGLAKGAVAVPLSQQLSASGGTPPYSWTLVTGALPGGVTLSTAGVISGMPTSSGTYNFTARVTDAAGLKADSAYTLAIANSLAITACPSSAGVIGQPYSSGATASGGQVPYTWTLLAGLLPAGLNFNGQTGGLSGTPTDVGSFAYTLLVTDKIAATATQDCSITIAGNLTITTAVLADASVSAPYAQSLLATGGKAPYTWSLVNGSLPPGLALSAGGTIAGAATQTGTFNFTLQVVDATGLSATKAFSIKVSTGLIVAACSGSIAETGIQYSSPLLASGGTAPYTWSLTGNLPPGLKFDPASGTISGTSTQTGSSQFTVVVTDKNTQTSSRQCSIEVRAPVTISTSSLAAGTTGQAYSASIAATAGVPPYVWTTSAGSLPPGLSLNAASGEITGSPVSAGAFPFTAQVTDNIGAQVTKDLSITIAQGLSIQDCPTPVAVIGQPYSGNLAAAGGTAPLKWGISAGALPPGLALDGANAVISGTPSQLGRSTFVLQVGDASGKNTTRGCSILVNSGALNITTAAALPNATVGIQYSQTLAAVGGHGPYAWSIASSGAPPTFSLSAGGVLTGTPPAPGSFTFTVQVTDQDNIVAQQSFTLLVLAGTPPNVTISGLTDIVDPAQQPSFDLQLSSSYPADITGAVTLTFTPDPAIGVDDPAVQFAAGGRTLAFTIPANASKAVFASPVAAFQTGTVAGTIQLNIALSSNGIDITPANAPSRTVRVDRLAPRISSVNVVQTSGGFELHIIGVTTTREVTQGTFQFSTSSSSAPIQVTVPMSDSGNTWFKSAASMQYGGQFSVVQPFTLQGQSPGSLVSVSVTLSNAQGTSDPTQVKF